MTPGYKTTEFWLSLIATVVGSLMTSGLIGDGTQLAKILGMIGVVLAAVGYTGFRSSVKKAT